MLAGRALEWLSHESGIRFLARRKAALLVAILIMGAALGANTLAFSATKAFLFSSFGIPESDRLFVIAPVRELPGRGEVVFADAFPNYELIQSTQRVFAEVACVYPTVASLDHQGEAIPVQAARVTASFFSTMRVSPRMGRAFTQQEEGPTPAGVVVVSDALWRGALGGDPAVLGRNLLINGSAHTVIGVMPPNFRHPLPGSDIWLPFDIPPQWRTNITGARSLTNYGRLKDGVSAALARSEAESLTRRSLEARPEANRDFRYTVQSVRQVLLPAADRTLWFVQTGALALVVLALSNLGSLLIAWGFERRQEMALRLAIGAGNGRIYRLLILQSAVVVVCGGVAGVLLAALALPSLRQLDVSPPLALYLSQMRIDVRVLISSAIVVAAAAFCAGLIPAFFAGRVSLSESLRSSSRSSTLSPAAIRWQKAMVFIQAAVSVVIVSAGVMIGLSFRNLTRIPDGFDATGRMVARIQLPPASYPTHERRAAFTDRLTEALARESDLKQFGFSSTLPVGDIPNGSRFFLEPQDAVASTEAMLLHFRRVSPTYFSTMNIPLSSGRGFQPSDNAQQPLVMIVSHALAQRLWPNQDPIGKRLYRVQTGTDTIQTIEVVGVAGNLMDGGYSAPPGETVYVPWPQMSSVQLSLVIEPRVEPELAMAAVRRALRSTDPNLAANNTASLQSLVSAANALPRLQSILLLLFAVVAISIVALGSYGVMTQLVTTREREFALRLLFGAAPTSLGSTVVLQVGKLSVAGILAGTAVVWALQGALQPLVFGISPRSAAVLIGVGLGVLGLAAASALAPAARAMRVDPRRIA